MLLIVSCPLALPVAVGANCTCNVIDCVGFSLAGKSPPTIVKPVPVIPAKLTVTGEVPSMSRSTSAPYVAKAKTCCAYRQLRTRRGSARAAHSPWRRASGRRVAADREVSARSPCCRRCELYLQRHGLGRVQGRQQTTPDDRKASPP